MFEALFWIAVGLILGWNLIPQPQVVADAYQQFVDWVKR